MVVPSCFFTGKDAKRPDCGTKGYMKQSIKDEGYAHSMIHRADEPLSLGVSLGGLLHLSSQSSSVSNAVRRGRMLIA